MGTKLNRRGTKPCRVCNGEGQLHGELFSGLANLIQAEVSSYCDSEYQRLLMEELVARKRESEQVTHWGVTCNMCEASPIKGIWYKVVDKDEYDLCQHCEAQNWEKDKMVLKIRNQEQWKKIEPFFKKFDEEKQLETEADRNPAKEPEKPKVVPKLNLCPPPLRQLISRGPMVLNSKCLNLNEI